MLGQVQWLHFYSVLRLAMVALKSKAKSFASFCTLFCRSGVILCLANAVPVAQLMGISFRVGVIGLCQAPGFTMVSLVLGFSLRLKTRVNLLSLP
jgi:hypothetical protein